MSGTLVYGKSQLVTRADLKTISPPAATETWKPVAHYDLIEAIDRQLRVRDIEIRAEQFAVQRDGARLFGVVNLGLAERPDTCAAMGIRNSTDKSLSLELAVGVRVFVCDNLCFSGDLIALRRKHTARFDLMADISKAIDRYQKHLTVLDGQVEGLKVKQLSHERAKAMMFDAVAEEIIPLRLLPVVSTLYRSYDEPPTAWTLHNIFTTSLKQLAPAPAFAATIELGKFFGLTSREDTNR
jgi:Domain of unknown function (DUF932)